MVVISTYIHSKLNWARKTKEAGHEGIKDDYEASNALLSDCIMNYKTIMSFGQSSVDKINEKFESLLEGPQRKRVNNFIIAGIANGLQQTFIICYLGACFFLGNYIAVGMLGVDQYLVFGTAFMMFSLFHGMGGQLSQIPSIQKARAASHDVFCIIDEQSTLDVRKTGEDTIHTIPQGRI